MVWFRKFGYELFEIGANSHINSGFSAGKFKASYELGDDGDLGHVTFTLTITGKHLELL